MSRNPKSQWKHPNVSGVTYMQERFELVFRESESDKAIALGALLSSRLGLGIHEIEQLLLSPTPVISRAANREALEPLYRELSNLGAKVSIVSRIAEADNVFQSFFSNYISGLEEVLESLDSRQVAHLTEQIRNVTANQGRILIIGNGGSAANASHMANDLNKRHSSDLSKAIKAISLTDNTPWISAIANDCGYDQIFVQQLQSILTSNDLLIAISSSGNSPNILNAVEFANGMGAITYGIVGFGGGKLLDSAQYCINIPTKVGEYGFMEDATLAIGHLIAIYLAGQDKL